MTEPSLSSFDLGSAYEELRGLAHSWMERERRSHTLDPTALVHEAWLRLERSGRALPESKDEVLRLVGRVMRHVLTDHARRRQARKRDPAGAERVLVEIEEGPKDDFLLDLDHALARLEHEDAALARLVEGRFFLGLGTDELASLLGLSPRTVKRRWRFARAWLQRQIDEERS